MRTWCFTTIRFADLAHRACAMIFSVSIIVMSLLSGPVQAQPCVKWTRVNTLPRFDHVMAYDSARGTTVMFGGKDGSFNSNSDTWEWDGANWTLRATVGPSNQPSPAMTYDS